MVDFQASIDEVGNDFRSFYQMVSIPGNFADLTIKVLESYMINIVNGFFNMSLSDILGSDNLMTMQLKNILFIVIYRLVSLIEKNKWNNLISEQFKSSCFFL